MPTDSARCDKKVDNHGVGRQCQLPAGHDEPHLFHGSAGPFRRPTDTSASQGTERIALLAQLETMGDPEHAAGMASYVVAMIARQAHKALLGAAPSGEPERELRRPDGVVNADRVCDLIDVDGSLEVTQDGATMSDRAFNRVLNLLGAAPSGEPEREALRERIGAKIERLAFRLAPNWTETDARLAVFTCIDAVAGEAVTNAGAAPAEREGLRDWATQVRDEILYPLAHREDDPLAPIAEGFGQALAGTATAEREGRETLERWLSEHLEHELDVAPGTADVHASMIADRFAAAPREQEHHPGCHQWSADEWVCQPECPHLRIPEPPTPDETREDGTVDFGSHITDGRGNVIAGDPNKIIPVASTSEAAQLARELDRIGNAARAFADEFELIPSTQIYGRITSGEIQSATFAAAAHLLRTLDA